MSRSLLQTANTSAQDVAEGGVIAPGNAVRRFGCNARLNGNAHEIGGEGYYTFDGAVSIAPAEIGDVTVALYENGVQIPGAIAYGSATAAGDYLTLPLVGTTRLTCCEAPAQITCVLVSGAGQVVNYSMRVEKA